jgi:hypothetical protein
MKLYDAPLAASTTIMTRCACLISQEEKLGENQASLRHGQQQQTACTALQSSLAARPAQLNDMPLLEIRQFRYLFIAVITNVWQHKQHASCTVSLPVHHPKLTPCTTSKERGVHAVVDYLLFTLMDNSTILNDLLLSLPVQEGATHKNQCLLQVACAVATEH